MLPAPDKDKTPGEDSAELPGSLRPDNLTKLGRYRLIRELGRGGFGVVYLAHDPKIGRDVAIKTIATSELRQPGNEQLFQRLYREAQSAGILSHSGIVTVYELEEDQNVTYIVMQFVNGPTLRDLMAAPACLPADKIVDILQQTAAALDFAHGKNVVHRDVKPANIMLDQEGSVKITDFGVAKMMGAVTQTQTATTVGTPFYMAPEQIRLGEVSGRTDQFALAVIAYEMLTGHRPFNGDSLPSLIHQILSVDPPRADAMNLEIPGPVGETLEKALAKDPADRYRTCMEFVKELRGALLYGQEASMARTLKLSEIRDRIPTQELTLGRSGPLAGVPASRSRWRYWAAGAFVAVFLAATPLAFYYARINAPADLTFPRQPLIQRQGQIRFPTLTADPSRIVYSRRSDGHFELISQEILGDNSLSPNPTPLTANETFDTEPAVSPDGKWIAFHSDRENGGIFVMDAQGHNVRHLADRGYNPAWSPDGQRICFGAEGVSRPEDRSTTNSSLWVVNVEGGVPELLYTGDAVQPSWSPHGQRIAFWYVHNGNRYIGTIAAGSGAAAVVVPVTDGKSMDWSPAWSPDGKYLYFSSDRSGSMKLWRVAIDEATGKRRWLAQPHPLGEQGIDTSYIQFAKDGQRFMFVHRTFTASIYKAAFDAERGEIVGEPKQITEGNLASRPDLSPDGKRIAFDSTSGKDEDLYLMDINGNGHRPLMQDTARDRSPRWSPDGKQVAYFSNRSGTWRIWVMDSDGKNQRQLMSPPNSFYPVWSPSGQSLIGTVMANTPADYQSFEISVVPNARVQLSQPLLRNRNQSFIPWSWSRDGRFLAGYRQGLDGRVTGITILDRNSQEYRQVTRSGSEPVWLHRSPSRLLYLDSGNIYLLDVHEPDKARIVAGLHDVARRGFSLSSDDSTIVFGHENIQSELWMGTSSSK